MIFKISNIELAQQGEISFKWALEKMPLIKIIKDKYFLSQPLIGHRLGLCLHVTKETAVFCMAAKELGAKILLCSANPLSAQDDICAFLASKGINIFAWRNETIQQHYDCMRKVLSEKPSIITDDGGVLHTLCIDKYHNLQINGGTEETTSGIKTLKRISHERKIPYPIIGVNNALTKYLFDNVYGTGQSVIDGLLRCTGLSISGKRITICGYGPVGKGVALKARGIGAIVTVTEVDPIRALQALMDGFTIGKLEEFVNSSDIFITCTGQKNVIRREHICKMKSGVLLANAGHFDVEIDVNFLYKIDPNPDLSRENIECFKVNSSKIYLISKGRVINLVCGEGNPPEIMSLSFANQLLSIIYLSKNYEKLENKVYDVPKEIDTSVGRYWLDSMSIKIDTLTEEQITYEGIKSD